MDILTQVLAAIVIGGLAGLVASTLLNRKQSLAGSVFVGVVGSVIGNLLLAAFNRGGASVTEFSFTSFMVSLFGAIVLVALFNYMQRGKIK